MVTLPSLVAPFLAAGWAVVVVAAVPAHARRRARSRLSTARGAPAPRASGGATASPGSPPTVAVARLGATVRRAVTAPMRPGHPAPDATATEAPATDGAADRRTGWAALAGMALLPWAPPLAAAQLAWAMAAPVLRARRARRDHEAAVDDQLPDVVDLLALATGAGLPVSAAVTAIHGRPGGPLGTALARSAALLDHGATTAEALGALAAVGSATRPLVDALAQHDRYGTPLLPSLERVAIEARSRRRRRAEEAARRLPVTLLFPLVLTTFPAFVLLTIVPLLAGSLGSLSLSPT